MSELIAARRRVHAAAQWLARLAYAYGAPAEDDAHASLDWRDGHLITVELSGGLGAASLDAMSLELDLGGAIVSLDEMGERDREAVISEIAGRHGLDASALGAPLPWAGEAPDADVEADATISTETRHKLVALFQSAAEALADFAAETANASTVRLWPHHFDIATLVSASGGFESIGVGLAPDDGQFATPYLYVTPWPYPDRIPEEAPAGWEWHAGGFTALIRRIAGEDRSFISRAEFDRAFAAVKNTAPDSS